MKPFYMIAHHPHWAQMEFCLLNYAPLLVILVEYFHWVSFIFMIKKKKSLNTIPIHSENRKQVKTDSYGPNGSLCVFTSHIEIWWETISWETACKHHAMYLIWWSDALIKMKVMKSVKWCTNNLQVQYVGGQSF